MPVGHAGVMAIRYRQLAENHKIVSAAVLGKGIMPRPQLPGNAFAGEDGITQFLPAFRLQQVAANFSVKQADTVQHADAGARGR